MFPRIATSILVIVFTSASFRAEPETAVENVMFPDGTSHDFGKVLSGTKHRCAFRIVNTTGASLRILCVRAGG